MLEFLRLLVRLRWPMRLASPIFGRFHPYRPGYALDPYPTYRRLREEAPVYFHPVFRAWILSRYDDVSTVLKSPDVSVRRGNGNLPDFLNPFKGLSADFLAVIESALLMLDPPDHTRIRNLVNKAFTPRVVDALRPGIQRVVDETLDAALERSGPEREIDLVRDFAVPVPLQVIADLLGVPAADRLQFKRWSTELSGLLDPVSAASSLKNIGEVFADMQRYFEGLFEERRRAPRDDLLSALVAARERGDRLDSSELLAVVSLILGAGHETTTNLLANAVVALLRNDGERKRLQQDPSLIESAVEEFLRYDSPVQATDRLTTRPLEVGGRRIEAGRFVLLLLGSANRDPLQFEEPDRLDLGRSDNRHLSFSQGVHFCLGAQLARAEAQIAVSTLLRRCPDLRGDPQPAAWRRSVVLRGPLSLPVRL